ncbi:MAG: rod shape-determining protein MreD [Parcubacteria group bacterium]
MAQKLAIFFLLFLLVVFQISVLPGIFPENSAPNILLVMLVFWTARKGMEKTWKLAILGGLLSDLFLFVPAGVNVFSFFAAIMAVNYLAKRFLVTHQAWRFAILFVLVAAGTVTNELALMLVAKILFIFQKISINIQPFVDWALAYKIINSLIIFAILYWPFKKIEAIFNLYGSRTDPKSNVR